MKFLPTHRHRLAAAATAAAVVLGGGTAAVVAATTTPAPAGTATLAAATTPAPTGSAVGSAAAAKHHARGLLARTDHATVELKVKGQWVTYDLDRGKVTSVSATSITLARPDGQSVTLAIDSATRFGHKVSAAAITVGAKATVISDDGTARRVVQAVHAHPKAMAPKAAAPSTSSAAA